MFETLRARGARAFRLAAHLRRMRGSAAALGWRLPWSPEELAQALSETLRANHLPESRVRLQGTPGTSGLEGTTGPPLLLVEAEPFPALEPADREVTLAHSAFRRLRGPLSSAKTCSQATNLLARRAARAAGRFEALLCNDAGEVCEAAMANLFAVRDGSLWTPPPGAGALPRITREVVIELARRSGIDVHEEAFDLESLRRADEVFLTSAGIEVLPVVGLEDDLSAEDARDPAPGSWRRATGACWTMSWDRSPAELQVEPLPWRGSPLDLFRRVATGRRPFALLSATADRGLGRFHILGCDPFHVWELPAGAGGPDPFDSVQALAARYPVRARAGLPFSGGLVGYLGYECLRWVESLPVPPPEPGDPPDAWFAAYGASIVLDAASRQAWLVASGWPEEREEARRARARTEIDALRRRAQGPPAPALRPRPARTDELRSSLPRERYLDAVRQVLRHIRAGDIYQANLTQRLEADLPGADPVELFVRLTGANAAPHAAYLDLGTWQVLSSSPERFVSLDRGVAESRPIKGTAGRAADLVEDRRRARALQESAKDRAENLMIVDLVRNDLSRVCDAVRVTGLAEVETYATLHHLVSTVRGRMRAGAGTVDLLRSVFPPGSMTGAPKIRAMQILQEVEPVRRGPYAGGLGYLSFDGRLDLSVVIRTLIVGGGRARFHVGGGVVADSDPEAELDESLLKASALRAVLAGAPPIA